MRMDKIPLATALERMLRVARETGEEEVGLEGAVGRVLSRDVRSKMESPPFNRSMMDGYAVVAEDTFGASPANPVPLKLCGAVLAGEGCATSVKRGEAVRLTTGAPIPPGATAVVRLEDAVELEGRVEVLCPVTPGRNISPAGEDVRKGDVVLGKGRVLRAHDIGVLAAIGERKVWVRERPLALVVSTGKELAEPGSKLRPGSVYDINTYTLTGLAEAAGAVAESGGIIRDSPEELRKLIGSGNWDLLLVSGATSVGELDFVPRVVEEHGKVVFHGVNMRPGSPVGFGVAEERPVFMLPGFPVAAIAAFELLVKPYMKRMLGITSPLPEAIVEGVLARPVASELGRVDFVRVRVERRGSEQVVEPLSTKGSGLITTLTRAQGYVLVDEGREGLNAGEKVKVHLF